MPLGGHYLKRHRMPNATWWQLRPAMTMVATAVALTAGTHVSLHWWMTFSVRTFNASISSSVRVDRMRSATSTAARRSASRPAYRPSGVMRTVRRWPPYSDLGVEPPAAHLVLHRRGHCLGAAVGQQSADEGAKPGLAFLPALLATFLPAFLTALPRAPGGSASRSPARR